MCMVSQPLALGRRSQGRQLLPHLATFLPTFSAMQMSPQTVKCQNQSRWGVKRRVGYLQAGSAAAVRLR